MIYVNGTYLPKTSFLTLLDKITVLTLAIQLITAVYGSG